ncbi:MAG: type III polyketide synthase, partial [Paracoccaceae bacterium]|nr:type III polyketide synthase [Paracoccaceae bacterium]
MTPVSSRAAPRLLSIATAVPPQVLRQDDILVEARGLLAARVPQFERLAPAFQNAGIDTRHSVVPLDWFRAPHGWVDRSAAYAAGAGALFREAAGQALAEAGLAAAAVDVIVTVSSTGVVTPTLEALVA